MKARTISLIAICAALSACGGGASGSRGGSVSLADYTNLNAATDLNELTSNATVDVATDTVNYSGFVNLVPDTGGSTLVGFVGNLDLTVNFSTDTVDGSATNFGEYTSASPSGALPAVSGGLDIDGTLTDLNESLGDGMDGTAVGNVGGYDFDMTFGGNILGADRAGVVIYLDNTADLGGGVGIAVQ